MTKMLEEGEIKNGSLANLLGERYLSYALSTIMHRALPDVRDGLKPVHRRLLYAMRLLKLNPNTAFKKSARVVGDVIGKYHPHGDQSVYDALVRLAQDFSVRYPLIDGQGNFGNIDGDNAAAMRYTEARLTLVSDALMDGLDEDTVDFRPNYDGSEDEPCVLPSSFPNLLANGSSGIAVGMATNIPPHNVEELCNGLLLLLKNPDATVADLVKHIPGPDFPTGGILIEPSRSILTAYETGRGGFTLRAKWEKEEQARGNYIIVITEIPYQVQKSRLIERIASLIEDKKLPLLADVRDESSEDIRLVLEPRNRMVDPEVLMEHLFKLTDLESKIQLNMNVLNAKLVPSVLSLKEVLQEFLNHRQEVLVRRSQYRLEKIESRLEILEGFLIAYLNLDEVIRIVRYEDNPKQELMRKFDLTETQAEAILNLKLRSLAKIEEIELKKEHDALSKERNELLDLLASNEKQLKRITEEVKATKQKFGFNMPNGKRLTQFADAPVVDLTAETDSLIEKEPITILCSDKGWIRAMKGHIGLDTEVKYKEGDEERFRLHAQTTDKIIIFASNGKSYSLPCDKLPGGRGMGEPVRLMIDLPNTQDIISILIHKNDGKAIVAGTDGRGFTIAMNDMLASTKTGKQILNVDALSKAAICREITGDKIALVGHNRKMIIFQVSEIPEMSKGKGVLLQRYKDGGLSDLITFNGADGLSWKGCKKPLTQYTEFETSRAGQGRIVPYGFPSDGKF